MSLLETIARKLGENKHSFRAISIIQLISTVAQFSIYLSLIYYYLSPHETDYPDETYKKQVRKVQSGPGAGLFIILYIVIFFFPTVQAITMATSIVWIVYNLLREKLPILMIISMIGNVIQVLLGLVSIALGIFLAISSPATVLFIVLSSVIAVLEIWSLIACVSSFAQHKWVKMQEEELRRGANDLHSGRGDVEGHERMVDEEHVEDLN